MSDASAAANPLFLQLRQVMPGIPDQDLPRFARAVTVAEPYAPSLEAEPADDVPKGQIVARRHRSERLYPGVERDYWVYLPQQLEASKPADLIVFQDGAMYLGPEVKAPAVLDRLIHAAQMPATIAVFVQPGEKGPGLPIYGGAGNRSLEYDSLGDAHARFLVEELLPEATRGLAVTGDPAGRAVCGLSSGGICAFTVAWSMPERFGKVISHCGSYVDIRGGNAYPALVRRAPAKPIRVFLQTGENDLDIVFGHWVQANRDLAAALAYRGYDHQLVIGQGGHSVKQGGALLPETMRWLWRDRMPGRAG